MLIVMKLCSFRASYGRHLCHAAMCYRCPPPPPPPPHNKTSSYTLLVLDGCAVPPSPSTLQICWPCQSYALVFSATYQSGAQPIAKLVFVNHGQENLDRKNMFTFSMWALYIHKRAWYSIADQAPAVCTNLEQEHVYKDHYWIGLHG